MKNNTKRDKKIQEEELGG